MPNIINKSFFINDLYIPLSQGSISGLPANTATPTNDVSLDDCISEVEKDLLIGALGLDLYNELQIALADIDNADARWQNLVKGLEYSIDGKTYKWEGLNSPKSLIAYAIYYYFLERSNTFLTGIGVQQPNAENATNLNPNYKMSKAWQTFLIKYQKGYLVCPNIEVYNKGIFIDWLGSNNEIIRSLYQFLNDKIEDYPEWENHNFYIYIEVNSFGL